MLTITKPTKNCEHRQKPRFAAQQFIRLQVMDDEENESILALTKDISDEGVAILTYFPLPVGTQVKIVRDNDTIACAEVADWEWDYDCDMARIGLQVLDKTTVWPIN